MKKINSAFCALLLILIVMQSRAHGEVYTFNDFIDTQWVKDPRISPDGKKIVFVIQKKNLKENTIKSALWVLKVDGHELIQFTTGDYSDSHPRFSPDGKWIAFNSDREGDTHIYAIPSDGGEARKISTLSTGARDAEWSPDGKKMLFLSDVFPECKTDEENKKRIEEVEKSKIKAKLFTELPYRVFDHWRDEKRSHLFVMPSKGGRATDLTPGPYEIPPIDLGGTQNFGFSPDSNEVCYVTNADPHLAWSTNNDIFTVSSQGGANKRITESKACDSNPRYSPDGKYIAYTAMERPGFEADLRTMVLYERVTGKTAPLTGSLDRSVDDLDWSPDSKTIYFCCEDEGYSSLYKVDIASKAISKITGKSFNSDIRVSPDGRSLVFRRESMTRPPELFEIDLRSGSAKQLTSVNSGKFSRIQMNPAEEFSFKAKDGTEIHGFLVKPPQFSPGTRYPLVYLIHGGPQGAWTDDFHPRWNTELFASRGYVVAAVNFRGSNGFGQKFTDAVSGDWGGEPYNDIMEGLDYLLITFPFIDKDRLSAIGASYGGYMVNWIMGHTDRFRAAISHAGVFNIVSKYGSTEELWFPEWEFRGTPYENRDNYEKWSPINFVKNFKTPCLVIHGQDDFRVPVSEGMQLFTALQRNNIPSKFLYFPDETHFITKPQNLELWYRTMFEWLSQWLK